MLVARGAENRCQAGSRNQTAEAIACFGAFGHVSCRGLEHVEHAVEIGGEHFSPLVLGAVDEGAPAAAANAGIGETAVDPAEGFQRGGHRRLDRIGVTNIADSCVGLALGTRHGRRRGLVLVGVAAPDRDVAAGHGERLRDAEPDTAIAPGNDSDAAGEVEYAHGGILEVFPFGSARFRSASVGGQMFWSNHGQGCPENQIWLRD